MRMLSALILLGLVLNATVDATAQSRCTTTRNPLTGATETRCSDGSSSTTTRNPLTGDLDTTIRPGVQQNPMQPQLPPQPKRCTTTRNALTGALETFCY